MPEPAHFIRPESLWLLHYRAVDRLRNDAKQRWYQCWETATYPHHRPVTIFRTYHQDLAIPRRPPPVPAAWLAEYEALGINMTDVVPEADPWWNQEVLELFSPTWHRRVSQGRRIWRVARRMRVSTATSCVIHAAGLSASFSGGSALLSDSNPESGCAWSNAACARGAGERSGPDHGRGGLHWLTSKRRPHRARRSVVVLDDLSTGRVENVRPLIDRRDFTFVNGDVRDEALVADVVAAADRVFHLAATVGMARVMADPARNAASQSRHDTDGPPACERNPQASVPRLVGGSLGRRPIDWCLSEDDTSVFGDVAGPPGETPSQSSSTSIWLLRTIGSLTCTS